MENTENITAYVEQEKRNFEEYPLNDVDLLVLSALLYAEFERYPHFMEPDASTRIGDLLTYGTAHAYVEHDSNPVGMEPLVQALVESPRFCGVRLEHFSCVVSEEPVAVQFGAACYRISDNLVVVAFRGTDSKLVGWQENLEMTWRTEVPGQRAALHYLHDAATAYPEAHLVVCGHSKGGCEAEFATAFAREALASRIDRAVSFDGPGLFKLGTKLMKDFEEYDALIKEQYDQVSIPIKRYIFPSMIGLMMESRDPQTFTYIEAVDEHRQHNVCSARVMGGAFATRTPSEEELQKKTALSKGIAALNTDQRRFLGDFVIGACANAGIGIRLTDEGITQLQHAMSDYYRTLGSSDQRRARHVMYKLSKDRS